uniref:hypothetical protein n=2 Tax=Flavobacterium sp. TaxID=239 RepID=UPI00404A0977
MDNQLSESFIKTISSSNLGDIAIETVEITIDSLMTEGVLKEFPIVGSLIGLWKTGLAIKDFRFLKKLLLFLEESSKLTLEEREKVIEKLEDDAYQEEAGEKLLAIIDQLETGSKAKLLGKAFVLFGKKEITKEEFWRVAFVIEKLPMSDILALKDWRHTNLNIVEEVRRHLYLSVGLGWFVINMSSTGFCWQERLCHIFEQKLMFQINSN